MSHTFCSMSEGLVFQVLRSPHTPNHLFCCLSRFPSVFFFSIALLHFLFSYVFLSSLAPFLSLRSALWDMLLIFHLEWRRAVQRHCNINSFLPSLAFVWLTRCTKPPQLFNSFYYSTPIRGFFPVNLVLICHTASIKQPPGWWSFWLFSFFLLVSFCCLHRWIPARSTCWVLVEEGAWLHSCGQSCGVLQWDGQPYGVTLGQKHMGALRFVEQWSLNKLLPT